MKKALFYLLLLFSSHVISAQVYIGDIILENQEAVDNFSINYPGVTYVDGSLIIGTPDYNENHIDDISSLNSLTGAETLKIFNCTNFNNWVPSQVQNLTLQYAFVTSTENGFSGIPSFTSNFSQLDSLYIFISAIGFVDWETPSTHIFESLTTVNYINLASLWPITISNLTEVNHLVYDSGGDSPITLPLVSALNKLECFGSLNAPPFVTPDLPSCHHINVVKIFDAYCVDGLVGLSSLTSVDTLFVGGANSISGLSNLVTANRIDMRLRSFNGLYSLQNVGTLDLTFIPFSFTPAIDNLEPLSSLQSVDSLILEGNFTSINGINFLQINDYLHLAGQDISFCSYPSICNFIANHGPEDYFIGENHAIGCSTIDEIESLCDPSISHISGEIFFDTNCDGVYDPGEFTILPSYAQLDTSGEIMYNVDQFLVLTEPSSTVTISTANMPEYYAAINPIEITTAEPGNLNPYLFIPVCAAYDFSDLQISVLQTGNLSPGFQSYWKVQVTNQGTTTVDFIPSYTINTTEFVASINSFSGSLNDYTITWEAASINPGETLNFNFRITLLPTATLLGQMFSATANVALVSDTDENLSNNTAQFEQEIIGAYDPNDKVVNTPQINIETIDPSQPLDLTYRVRFQNTGTAPAVNVRVEDILEEDLDPSTFELLESSHVVYYQIQGNQLTFFFNNIMLPDSTSDPEGSIGTFFFRIKSNGNHTLESSIDNQVSIFFDFNEPIITNVASTIFYECPEVSLVLDGNTLIASEGFEFYEWTFNGEIIEGVNGNIINPTAIGSYVVIGTSEFGCSAESNTIDVLSTVVEYKNQKFVLYPNPVNNLLNVESDYIGAVNIFNSKGKLVQTINLNGQSLVDVSKLPSGLYQLVGEERLLGKFVKE
ncbi:MAG: T9SS type A sorting domain-containing protein [Flavobacteriales bacterium]|jgi:hypothetical protein